MRTPGPARRSLLSLRLLVALPLLGSAPPLLGQETVVVFRDHRSLTVSGHRESGAWTYLTVENGEIAVPSSRILEIRNERPDVKPPAGVLTPSPLPGPSPAAETPPVPPSAMAETSGSAEGPPEDGVSEGAAAPTARPPFDPTKPRFSPGPPPPAAMRPLDATGTKR